MKKELKCNFVEDENDEEESGIVEITEDEYNKYKDIDEDFERSFGGFDEDDEDEEFQFLGYDEEEEI